MTTVDVVAQLRGPAVIVDDDLDGDDPVVDSFVQAIRVRGIPLLEFKELPPVEVIRHWRATSLIILDWDLQPYRQGLGMALPTSLIEAGESAVVGFVSGLLDQTYCPVFIFSNQDVDSIWRSICAGTGKRKEVLQNRVHIRAKHEVSGRLFDEVGGWIAKHPAIYVWKAWEQEYENASGEVFREFEASAADWPAILWATSNIDKGNPDVELAEVIGRNVLHRFRPLVFSAELILAGAVPGSRESLRRILHRQAVVGGAVLRPDVLSPGDFFYSLPRRKDEAPASVLINITPACDLVARRKGQTVDDVRMLLLKAEKMSEERYVGKSEKKVLDLLKNDSPTSEIVHLLLDTGVPYEVNFRDWEVKTWRAMKKRRRGRLLEPYITQLQQKNALYMHRQGLPRLPVEFYTSPGP